MAPDRLQAPPQTDAAARRRRLLEARLYLVTDDATPDAELPRLVAEAVAGGVDMVQLRRKLVHPEELLPVAQELRQVCSRGGALFLVDDHVELAVAVGADGVHLGQEDTSVEKARQRLGEGPIIGLSTHDPDQARDSVRLPVDYISAGPVFVTPTKPGRPATGMGYIAEAARVSRVPVVAIGGLTSAREAVGAGADIVGVVRAICGAESPRAEAQRIRDEAATTRRWVWLELNGERHKVAPDETVASLLGRLQVSPDSVAVELNGTILQRQHLGAQTLHSGDVLEVVHFVGGG